MDAEEYSVMARVESDHWWYRGLRDRVVAELESRVSGDVTILDAGCGTGGTLVTLERRFPSARIIGIDASPLAISYAREKVGGSIAYGSVNALPVADSSIDAITSLDVIYHDGVDEKLALNEMIRVLKPNGIAVVNVPAFEWIRSRHDVAVHTAHRYTTGGFRGKAKASGFDVLTCQYRNSLLFPLMLVKRLMQRSNGHTKSNSAVNLPSLPINYLFGIVLAFENRLTRFGVKFPAGGSVFALLVKRAR